jgi:hypothetical protein
MKTKKTMMVLALVLVSSMMMTALTVQASGNKYGKITETNAQTSNGVSHDVSASLMIAVRQMTTQTLPRMASQVSYAARSVKAVQVSNMVKPSQDIKLADIDESIIAEIDARVKAYEELPEEEKKPHDPSVWIVVARGFSLKSNSFPELSEVAPEVIPMGMRFYAKAIWGNIDWTLYKLGRGVIGHDGERYHVDGYALYKKETGKFYLVLDGDDVSLHVVGIVYGPHTDLVAANCRRSLHLAMKGRMSIDGDGYVFALRGSAYRLPTLRAKPVEKAEIHSSN